MLTTTGCLRCERTGILSHCHTGVAAPGSRAARKSKLIELAAPDCSIVGEKGGITEIASPRGKLLTAWGQRSDTAGIFSHPPALGLILDLGGLSTTIAKPRREGSVSAVLVTEVESAGRRRVGP